MPPTAPPRHCAQGNFLKLILKCQSVCTRGVCVMRHINIVLCYVGMCVGVCVCSVINVAVQQCTITV